MAHAGARLRTATVAAALVACALLGAAGCGLLPKQFRVIQPGIVPSRSDTGSQAVTREFEFESRRVTLTVPVDRAVYVGSTTAQKSVIFIGGEDPGDWVPDYYRAFVNETHQEPFYAAIVDALHQIRQQGGLDSARYVELVTSMAQSLEYRVDPVNLAPKFPIETFTDGYGDCDDKALLAAAILARDGYDVAILLFTPEKHVALGIRAPGLDYKQTGYAYVEMTEPSLVGVPAEKLSGGVTLESQPVVIRVGEGSGAYTAGAQIEYIQKRLGGVRAEVARLRDRIAGYKADLAARQSALDAAKRDVGTATDPVAHNAAAQRYNALVDQYNAVVAKSNAAAASYNALLEVERFVAGHQTARPQVYERLRAVAF